MEHYTCIIRVDNPFEYNCIDEAKYEHVYDITMHDDAEVPTIHIKGQYDNLLKYERILPMRGILSIELEEE